jgi:hypothetical protein
VFSLAATLYALLAGRPPRRFDGGPLTKADLTRLADQPIPQLPQVSWNLMGALSDALSDDTAARPRAATLRDRLAALDLDAQEPRARRTPAVPLLARGGRRSSPAAMAASPLGRAALDDSPESPRRRGLLVPLLLVAALFVTGGWVAAWRANQGAHSSVVAGPAAAATAAGAEPTQSASPEPAGDGTATTHSEHAVAAAEHLAACQRSVRAADQVVREAKVGIGHWKEHVQAQTDMFAGKITGEEMGAIFTRTRLAGPADVQRYSDALRSQARAQATCEPVEGAPAEIETALTRCEKRADAQKPVLAAAEDGMGDWRGHLEDMASRQQYRHNAQFHWLQTWRAAPPHLNAWKRSLKEMDAPSC